MIIQYIKEIYARQFTERYLIYKGSGGLFHNLTALSKAIRMAERQNRKLIIDMKQCRSFMNDFSTFFTLDKEHWENYSILEKFDSVEINTIRGALAKGYKKQKINFEDKIIVYAGAVSGLIDKRLKVNNQIMEKLKKEESINEPYIAVHFRNTDRKNDIFQFIERIKKASIKQNIKLLYVASDDFYAFEIMKKHLIGMRLIRKVIPQKDVRNIHYHTADKYKQIYESLLDVYFILQSNFFIPSYNSGYSKGIINMLENNNYLFPDFSSQTKVVAENA
jgi:hypothetical protein